MKNNAKTASLLTAALMLFSFIPSVPVRAEETVAISTVSDFKQFTEGCVYDEYSRNKKFVLENDLDLSGAEIKNAEVFCGIFEGGGHTIRNMSFSFEGSGKGLFCSVSRDAQIRDLNVSGEIKVTDEKGESTEKILRRRAAELLERVDITYDEIDDSAKAAGGIAGYNEGTIVNCSFEGSIDGKRQVGGIAGFNSLYGVIDSCTNNASVNGDKEIGGIVGYNEGRVKLSKNNGEICRDADENTINVGGITGNSEGAVIICTNNASIGGDSFGDNVGGISGKQSGELRECINYGYVRGRRSVGGICGRFEPYTDIELSYESAKAALDKQLDNFRDDVEDARQKLIDLADELLDGKGIISDILDRLGIEKGSAGSRLDRLTDSATDMMDSITGAANDARDNRLASKLSDSLDSLKDFSDETKDSIKDASTSLNDSLDSLDDFLDEFDGKGQELSDTLDNLNDAIEKGQDDVDEIKDRVLTQADDLEADIDDLERKLNSTHALLQTMMRNVGNAGGSIDDFVEDIDDSVKNTRDALNDIKKKIHDATAPIRNIRERISNRGATPAPSASETAEPQPETEFQGYIVSPENNIDSEGYNVEPSIVGSIFSVTAYAAGEDGDDKKTAISDLKSTDIVLPRYIGGENADTALIKYCINCAEAKGNEMVGGVAGSVGFESAIRTGDSITLPGGTKVDADSILKAVIDGCVSDGAVTSKTGYAGGAAGKCDIGDIKNTLTTGEIKVADGGYSGGIAGYSSGEIRNCIAIDDMEAQSYVGGIVGNGKNIYTSYSLPRLDGKKDRSGAVAGFASGEVYGCYFIDEGLSGINGASLEGKAEAVAPENIAASDGVIPSEMFLLGEDDFFMEQGDLYMPQIEQLIHNNAEQIGALLQSKSSELSRFHFKVSFVDKGKELRSMVVDYGTVLADSDIPRVSADGTEVPMWNRDVRAPIVRRTVFTTEYNRATTTISTDEEPPILLVESIFDDGTEVTLHDEVVENDFKGYNKGGAYSFELSKSAYDVIKVHIRDDNKKAAKVAVLENGRWTLIDCETDGSYAVFTVGAPCKFVVLYKNGAKTVILWVAIGVVLAAAAAAGIVIYRRRKNAKKEI